MVFIYKRTSTPRRAAHFILRLNKRKGTKVITRDYYIGYELLHETLADAYFQMPRKERKKTSPEKLMDKFLARESKKHA